MGDLFEIGRLQFPNAAGLLITAAFAAWNDWREWRIPNRLLAGSATAALMIASFYPDSIRLVQALQGGLIGLLLLLPLYAGRGMAAGDVKLMAVLGLHVGPVAIVQITFLAFLVGGVWSALRWMQGSSRWIAWHAWIEMQKRTFGWFRNGMNARTNSEPVLWQGSRGTIPYGVVIAIAALAVGLSWAGVFSSIA